MYGKTNCECCNVRGGLLQVWSSSREHVVCAYHKVMYFGTKTTSTEVKRGIKNKGGRRT